MRVHQGLCKVRSVQTELRRRGSAGEGGRGRKRDRQSGTFGARAEPDRAASTGASTPPSRVRGGEQTGSRTSRQRGGQGFPWQQEMSLRTHVVCQPGWSGARTRGADSDGPAPAPVGFHRHANCPTPLLWAIWGEAKLRMKANISRFYFLRLELLLPCGSWPFLWPQPERLQGPGCGEMPLE